MSIRKDIADAIAKARSIPRSNLTADRLDSVVKDIEVLVRFAHPTDDRDIVAEATATIAALRASLTNMPVATRIPPCAYCGCRALLACNTGRVELAIGASTKTIVAHYVVCSNCGDLRTLTDPAKLPEGFAPIEALG